MSEAHGHSISERLGHTEGWGQIRYPLCSACSNRCEATDVSSLLLIMGLHSPGIIGKKNRYNLLELGKQMSRNRLGSVLVLFSLSLVLEVPVPKGINTIYCYLLCHMSHSWNHPSRVVLFFFCVSYIYNLGALWSFSVLHLSFPYCAFS